MSADDLLDDLPHQAPLAIRWDNLRTYIDASLAAAIDLADLGDVSATVPTTGQVLTWSGSSWTPDDASGGGLEPTNVNTTGTVSAPAWEVVDVTAGDITRTLPASPTAGAVVVFSCRADSGSNELTIVPGSGTTIRYNDTQITTSDTLVLSIGDRVVLTYLDSEWQLSGLAQGNITTTTTTTLSGVIDQWKGSSNSNSTSVANTTITMSWTESVAGGGDITHSGTTLTFNETGFYLVVCNIRTTSSNRTELIVTPKVNGAAVFADTVSDYVSRDSDQNTGGISVTWFFEMTATDTLVVNVEGDCDGTCTITSGSLSAVRMT